MTPWVIVPCSGAKRPEPVLPARDRYTGSLHRLAMQAALALTTPDRVRIMSARYGLLSLDDRTEPYDLHVSSLNYDDARAFRSKVHVDACSMYWADGRRPGYAMEPVIALVPSAYLDALQASPLLERALICPLLGSAGIGEMRGRLAAVRNTGTLPDQPKEKETPMETNSTPTQAATGAAIIDALKGDPGPLEAIVEKVEASKPAAATTKKATTAKKATAAKKASPRKSAAQATGNRPAKATAKKATPVKAAAKKAAPKPTPEPKKVPTAPAGSTLVEILPEREIIFASVSDALARMPKGSKTKRDGGYLVVVDPEAQAVVTAITEHMRAIVKEDRSANMYREGKLRGVRTAVLAKFKGLEVPSAARAASAGAAPADKAAKARQGIDEISTYKAQKAALKEWEALPEAERGPRPDTDVMDRIQAEYEAKETKKSAEAEARKKEREEAAAAKQQGRKEVSPIPKAKAS